MASLDNGESGVIVGRNKVVADNVGAVVRRANIEYHMALSNANLKKRTGSELDVKRLPITFPQFHHKNKVKGKHNVNLEALQPGRAYIINHVTFNDPNLKERKGSELDVKRLRTNFLQFGMKVKRVHDGTLADIRAVMEKISVFDFRNLSCLVVVIMSHGYEGNIIAAKDGNYSLDHDIMYPILQNKSLTSKLKLLVVQACKGPVNPLLEIEGPRKRPTVIPSEILQITSCVEGYVSYLDPSRGSIFIRIFCEHLEKFGMKKNILDIANAVVADVKKKYNDIQIPMVHTNLTKMFVFGHYIKDSPKRIQYVQDVSSEEEPDE